MSDRIYIAGPMRGHNNFNFASFFAAEIEARTQGAAVYNPAAMDIEDGSVIVTGPDGAPILCPDPTEWECLPCEISVALSPTFSMAHCRRRDWAAIIGLCSGLALLGGWERSEGAKDELWIAEMTGKDIYTVSLGSNPLLTRRGCNERQNAADRNRGQTG